MRAWPSDLAVVIPVYNHSAHIGRVIRDLRHQGASVTVVNDGSTDSSAAVAQTAGAHVISYPDNRGKAAALRIGFEHAANTGWSRVLTCDADGQHPLAAITSLSHASASQPNALWLGRRCMTGAPARSRVGRWCSNLGVAMACGLWPGDSQSGLRIYPVQQTVGLTPGGRGFSWEVDILVRARRAGIPVRSHPVPVVYPRSRVSHFRPVADTLATAASLLRGSGRRVTETGQPGRTGAGEVSPAVGLGQSS